MTENLTNGGVPPQPVQYQRNERLSNKNKKAPDIPAIESNNWLLHRRYIRHEYKVAKNLIDKQLESTNDNNEYANYLKGMILRKEGEIQQSLEYFEKCYELNSISVINLKQMAKSLFLLGNHRKAIQFYQEALQLTKIPDWQIHLGLGECYMAVNSLDEAHEELKRAIDLTRHIEPYLVIAQLYMMQNKIHNVIQIHADAKKCCRKNEKSAMVLGIVYLKMGNVKKAFEQFGTVLLEFPEYFQAIIPMGFVMQNCGERDVALCKYKLALQVLPESYELWNNIGMCLYRKKKFVAAISCLKRAQYLHPLAPIPPLNLGKVFLTTSQPASAAIYFCAAIANSPKDYMPYLLLSLALKKLGDVKGAEKVISKAHSLSPQNPVVLVNYAIILQAVGNYKYAVEIVANLNDISVIMDVDPKITEIARKLVQSINHTYQVQHITDR